MTCSQCGSPISGTPVTTPTGARLCASCGDRFNAVALAMMSGGGVGEATALAGRTEPGGDGGDGILAWVRRALRRR